MKKKLISLLIALCLIVVMIPILANAAEATATVKFAHTTELTVTRGGESKYLKNAANGTVSEGTQDDHTVEFVYPTGGVPTIYLRDAYLNSGVYGIESMSNDADSALIVVEKMATPTAKNGVEGVDSYLAAPIKWTHGNLEIRGYVGETAPTNLADMAKLKLTSIYDGFYCSTSVTFKAVDLNMQATESGKKGFSSNPILVEFYGGKAVIDSHDIAVYIPGATAQGLVIDGGADVTLHSVNHNTVYLDGSSAVINVKDGKLSMTSDKSGYPAVRTTNASSVLIKKGTLEFNGLTGIDALIDLTEYQNAAGENYYHTSYIYQGEPGVDTREKVHPSWYSYIKIEPAYAVAVTGGDADVAKAPVGATVTLTPGAAPAGQTFDGWTSDDVTVAENEGVYTFTMPAKNVAVSAKYVSKATINLAGTDYTFTDAESVYLKTATDGAISNGTATDYNVKLAYDANNVPTVYLNGATVTASGTALSGANFAIVTESASKISQTGSTADNSAGIVASGKVTFSGAGRLTVEGVENAIYGSGAEIELNDANVKFNKVSGSTWGDAAFAGSITKLTFNGGTVDIESSYMGLYCTPAVVVNDDAIVNIDAKGSVVVWGGATFTVNSGYLKAYASVSGYNVFEGVTNITVNGGTFEAYNAKAGGVLAAEPTLYSGAYAVAGSSKETAAQYTTGNLTDQFFKVGTAYTVTVTNGTAQSIGAAAATTKAFVGDEVALAATAPDGQILTNWEVTAGTAAITGNTLTMPAGDVTVKANFGYGASITIGDRDYTVIRGGAAMCFKTDANGNVTDDGNEHNYNMMFVYADTTDAVPTLYLRNAYVATAIKSNTATLAKTAIVVEDTASGKVTTAEGDISADAYLTGAITWTHGDLEIQGLGKVLITKTITTTGKALSFKNADVELKTGTSVGLSGQNITFDGGKFVFEATNSLISDWNATNPAVYTILVKNDASVSVTSENSALVLPYATSASTLTVDSGHLKLASISDAETDGYGNTLRIKDTAIKINGGIVEIVGSKSLVYGCTPVLNLAEYTNYCASYSSSAEGTNLKEFATDTITNHYQNAYAIKYIKIGPAYTVTVNGATASHTKASVGDVITLTPERRAGYKLDSWTVDSGSTPVTIIDNKFTMPAGNVSITANYVVDPNADAEPDEVVFMFAGTKVTVVRGETYYFITKADGTVTAENATADNYNIKIVYERVKDKTPVIYLRGAYIKGSYGSIINNDYSTLCTDNERASKVTIVVEDELGNATSAVPSTVTADSYLVSYIFLSKGDVEVQGPGKLVIDQAVSGDTTISGNIQAGGDLIFKNADVQLLNGGLKGKNITFDGGKVDATVTGSPVISIWQNPYTVLVKNDAQVSMTSTDKAAMHIVGTDAALQIESGSLLLKSTATGTNSEDAALKISGGAKLKMSGGTLEISGTVTIVTGNIDMELTGNFDAVCANNAEGTGAVDYNLLPALKQYNSSWQLKYIKIQPGTGSGNAGGGNAGGGNTGSHTHSTTKVSGKAASCTADGVKEHYKCSCGKYFEDKAATKEIKDINTWKVIKATGHKDANKDGKCDTCKAAQTSDSSFNALWITLLTVSTLGLCVTFVYNKKMRATK